MTDLTRSCIYYTDSQLDESIAGKCREQLRKAFDGEIVSVSLKPLDFGDKRIVLDKERGYGTLFEQILAGVEASTADVIFHAEHDILYPPEHFDFTPPERNKFYYDLNWWKIRKDGFAIHWDAVQVSGLCYYKELGLEFYRSRVATFDPKNFDRKFEPTVATHYETWRAPVSHIDIRHDHNLTYNKWGLRHFRKKETAVNLQESRLEDLPGWKLTVKEIY